MKNDQKYILQTAGRMNIFFDGQTNGRITNVLSIPDFYLYSIGVCVGGGVSGHIYVQMLTLLIPIDLPTTFMAFFFSVLEIFTIPSNYMPNACSSKQKIIIIQVSQWKLTVIKIFHHLLHREHAIYNIFFDLYTDARKIFNACLCLMTAILKNGRHFWLEVILKWPCS